MISNFNKSPEVRVTGWEKDFISGWDNIVIRLNHEISKIPARKKVIAVECYQGVDDSEVLWILSRELTTDAVFHSRDAFLPEEEIRRMTQPDVTDDRIFGILTKLNMEDFFDRDKIDSVRSEIHAIQEGTILLYGPGASVIFPEPGLLVYADMARWEIQLRMRRNEVSNLGITNISEHIEGKYKRGYFVDWRVCDRLKKRVMPHCDWVLDTNRRQEPGMISGNAFREGLRQAAQRPFSVVPYFDAGPWGGQWMKETFDLGDDAANYAWCFNCVPEENSLYLDYGGNRFETPAINLVFFRPEELLGGFIRERFGDEFPIRFDFLDTMDGGNLSLQVHPLTSYIRATFGQDYTQDESYYLVEAAEGARVYLGLREGINPERMITDLRKSENTDSWFDDTRYIQSWPARRHDHFLIPGGTVHCSGKDCMVLEISATPYIFTFKLWDWGRLGMDGKPRPINIDHGIQNIQWDRTEDWVRKNLVNRTETVNEGDGWREEWTGLHESEFIDTRRHRFTKEVLHNTRNTVQVICLVEGREIMVGSPSGAFDPVVVHFAETFIVPAGVGEYTIRPYGESEGKECITIKAFVRQKDNQ